jgi:hypothetical protein
VLATGLLGAGMATPREVLLYFSVGTIGGLLPDLDSDNSVVLRVMVSIIAVFFSFLAMFTQADRFSIAELLLIWLCCFIAINYGVGAFFRKYTVHRGLFHSIPAGLLTAGFMAILSFEFLKLNDLLAWMSACFLLFGYLVHLLLDEIYSVDLANKRMKRSSGSAFKLGDMKNPLGTFLLYAGALLILFTGPSPTEFWRTITRNRTYVELKKNLLPDGAWFEGNERSPRY